MNNNLDYQGHDLEVLAATPRYHQWIMEYFAPRVTGRTAEIGAGVGTFSDYLSPLCSSLQLVEPSEHLVPRLRTRFQDNPSVDVIAGSLEEYLVTAESSQFDTLVMVNVLEHIEDDLAAVRELNRIQVSGGHLLLFVPALPWLFSRLDGYYGHFRRYTFDTLKSVVASAGYSILEIRYLDVLGILPWYLMNTLGGKTEFNPALVKIYDSVGIPITKIFESVVRVPFGKNLILIGRKD